MAMAASTLAVDTGGAIGASAVHSMAKSLSDAIYPLVN